MSQKIPNHLSQNHVFLRWFHTALTIRRTATKSLVTYHLMSGLKCLVKNTQAQLTVTIHSGTHKKHKVTFLQLFGLNSVLLILGLNCLEENTQAQLTVTIHSGTHNRRKVTSLQLFGPNSARTLDIRLKLFGEEHSSTADSYHTLGDTQQAQGNFSAFWSKQRALDIRLKLFGEEHSSTADSYHTLGDTQHALGDFSSAFQSKQRALDIRLKLFGEGHSRTADSYHTLRRRHTTSTRGLFFSSSV